MRKTISALLLCYLSHQTNQIKQPSNFSSNIDMNNVEILLERDFFRGNGLSEVDICL